MESIIQKEKQCLVCHTTKGLHRHHVYHGPLRSVSEKNGFTVYSEPPALSRRDNKTEICSVCATQEALEEAGLDCMEGVGNAIIETVRERRGGVTPQERTRRAVAATGNKWAMENFNATHN